MKDLDKQKNALRKLLAHCNYSKIEMADFLSVDKSVVYAWFGRGRISATKAIETEQLTGGKIKKQELRPDIADWQIEE